MILNACRSKDRGKNIAEIVKNSNNDSWKANLAEVISAGDLLTKNFVYHHRCYTQNWKKYSSKQKKSPKNNDLRLMAAELEFMNVVQKRIDSDEYIKFPSIKQFYSEVKQNYGISNELSDYQLKEKLLECVEGIIFTPGHRRQPPIVHSKMLRQKQFMTIHY